MKIEVNIEKRYFFILLSTILLIGAGIFVYAYNPSFDSPPLTAGELKTADQVSVLGHSSDEVKILLPKSTDSNVLPYTLQQAIDLGVLAPTVSKRYICDGRDANTPFVSCTIPNSNRWAGCFMVGFDTPDGISNGQEGCIVTKTAVNGPWQFIINQQTRSEPIICSARCITGNGAESFGAEELTVTGLDSPPDPKPEIPQ